MNANEELARKLQELESILRVKKTQKKIELELTQSELAIIIAALAVQDFDEQLRREGLSE